MAETSSLPRYSGSLDRDTYDDSKHSLYEPDVGVSRYVPNTGGRDVSINSGGIPISYHIYKAGSMLSKDQVVKADDKSTVLYNLQAPHALSWSLQLFPADATPEQAPLCVLEKGSFGFSSTDIKVTLSNGWSSVLHSTGIYSRSRDFAGMPLREKGEESDNFKGSRVGGEEGGRFRWGSVDTATGPKGEGGSGGGEIQCMDLGTRDIVAIWRRTPWAAKKSGELKVNRKYEQQTTLILATAFAVEEWRKEQATSFKAVHTM
ncbi:hypothetical protein RQP46_011473 [Phenoliferia psychrophenolica]